MILCSCTLDRLQKSQGLGQKTHHLFLGVVLWSYRVALGGLDKLALARGNWVSKPSLLVICYDEAMMYDRPTG